MLIRDPHQIQVLEKRVLIRDPHGPDLKGGGVFILNWAVLWNWEQTEYNEMPN